MLRIEILCRVRRAVPRALLERACVAALRHGRVASASIDVVIVGDRAMRLINARHLGHDYTTDVLSFNLGKAPDTALLASLVINRAYAARSARARGLTEAEELARYALHGTLHVLGYDDATGKARDEMWEVQEKLLRSVMSSKRSSPRAKS